MRYPSLKSLAIPRRNTLGEKDTFAIQVKASVKNGELTPEQVREVLITVASYAGYPRAAGLIGPTEQTLAQLAKEKAG